MTLPWFKCEPGPLLGALSALDPDQKLLYVIILLRIYEVGGPIKDDDDALSNRCGLTLRRTKIAIEKLTAKGKIERTQEGLLDSQTTHERLADRREIGNVRKTFGKSGAKKRWQKDQQNQRNGDSKPIANGCRYKKVDSSVASPNGESTGDKVAEIALVRDPDGELFFRSRQVFGPQCGGMIVRLKTAYGGDIAKARAFVEQAALKGNPVEYLAKALHNSGAKPAPVSEWMLTA